MGKVAKVAVPLAIAAGAAYLTGGASLAATGAAGSAAGAGAAGAAAGGAWGSAGTTAFMSNFGASSAAGAGLFSSANIGMAFSGLSALSSVMGGMQDSNAAAFEIAQLEENRKLARIEGLQAEEKVRADAKRVAAAARAKGAAMGIDVTKSRSFTTFLTEQEKLAQNDILNIGISSGISAARNQLQIAGAKSGAKNSRTSSYIGAGRSLLSGYRNYQDTRGATT